MTSLNKVGIVLSGGGTKLYTHIGLLEALADAGLLNDQVGAVVGTSAGSIAGALYALGYTPREVWELLYWRAWGYDPPDDSHYWRADTRPRPLNRFIDLDFENMERALTRNFSYFKGLDTGKKVEAVMRKYLDWRGQESDGEFSGSRPPERRTPLYIVALNITNRRQALFHFEAHCRPHPEAAEATRALAPAPGREARYEYYYDIEHLDKPPEEQMQVWEAVRCSTCLPTVFQPYLKRNLTVDILNEGKRQRVTQTAYYTDGGARDNYSLSTAMKVANCDAVFGQYLGDLDYPFQVMGHGTIVDVVNRNIGAMMQAIYEADQDDSEIHVQPVRTIVPIVHVRPDVTFDTSDIGGFKEAGYIAAAYYLWQCHPGARPRDFFQALLDGQVRLTWDEVFHAGEETWGPAAQGRRRASLPDSDYYVIRPTDEFVSMAREVCAVRYPAPRTVAATAPVASRLSLANTLEQRNKDLREVEPGELDQPAFQGPLQQAQATAVKWGRRLAWFSASGILAYGLSVLWVGLGWLAKLSSTVLIWGEVIILGLSLVAGWFSYRWAARTLWRRVQGLFARRVGVG